MIVTISKGRKSYLVRVIAILIAVQARVPFMRMKQLRVDLRAHQKPLILVVPSFDSIPGHEMRPR